MENPNTMTEVTHILEEAFSKYVEGLTRRPPICGTSFGRTAETALNAAGYKIVLMTDEERHACGLPTTPSR